MTALRDVLCATDIERPARTALRYAFFVAEHFNASLSVVHAREFIQGGQPNLYVSNERRFAQLINEQHALERLDALVRTVPAAGTGRATTHVVDGKLVEVLASCSDRYHSNLILLGANVRCEQAVTGEDPLSQQLGDRTFCPVMTVPHVNVSSLPRIQRILCPIERRPGATKEVVAWVVLLARRFGAIVEVLHDRPGIGSSHDEVEESLRVAGVGTTTGTCSRGSSLADVSLERVAQRKCDLVVMSATSHDAARSTVLSMVRRESVVPVLSIRSKDANRVFTGDPYGASSADDDPALDARAAASAELHRPVGAEQR